MSGDVFLMTETSAEGGPARFVAVLVVGAALFLAVQAIKWLHARGNRDKTGDEIANSWLWNLGRFMAAAVVAVWACISLYNQVAG